MRPTGTGHWPRLPDMTLVIVTAVLNDPLGLSETLGSLNRPDGVALLVVDGGSRQETLDVGRQFACRSEDRLNSSIDQGPYDAMNRALDMVADSDLIWFLNAGDVALDEAVVSDVLAWTSGSDFVWGYGPVQVVEADGTLRRIPAQSRYSVLNHASGRTPICHQTVVARASALKAVGGFDLDFSLAADFKLLLRLGQRWPPVTWPRPIVAYRAGGLSDANIFKTRQQQRRIQREELQLDRRARLLVTLRDAFRLSRLLVGSILDGFAAHHLLPKHWRRTLSSPKSAFLPGSWRH